MKNLKVLTQMHLLASRKMPYKHSVALTGDVKSKYERQLKRDRKDIARYYRLIRSGILGEHYTAESARISHRYAVVTTGSEARIRIKNLTAEPSTTRWN